MLFKKKSIWIAVLTALVILFNCFYISASATDGSSLDELKQKSTDLKQQSAEIQDNIDALEDDAEKQDQLKAQLERKILNTQEQIDVYSNQIAALKGNIDQLDQDIADKEDELAKTKELFKQRLRAMYVSGSPNELLMLLSSDDVADYLSKTELTRSVSEHDNQMMDQIVQTMQEIQDAQQKLKDEKASKESVQSTLTEMQKDLESQIEEVQGQIEKINSEKSDLSDQKEELDGVQAATDENIQRVLEDLKAQQEAQNQSKNSSSSNSTGSSSGGSSGSSDPTSSIGFTWPVPGFTYITSPYGYRTHPIYGTTKFHSGIDISGSNINGTPIHAADNGTVALATYDSGGYGYYVLINHGIKSDGNQYSTLYGHMTKYIVSAGQYVNKGDVIGYVGSTGASTGPHLHFEIRINGSTVNPLLYY